MAASSFSDYLSPTERVIYVDADNGDDSNRGNTVLDPVETLNHAVSIAAHNSLIVLQNGDYGSLSINKKNLFLLAAYGSSPTLTSISAIDSHVSVEGVKFEGAGVGINMTNSLVNKGSATIRKCRFDGINEAVSITRCRSISLHQNTFTSCPYAVTVNGAGQATISSNVVVDSEVPFRLSEIPQLDLFHNTVNGNSPVGSMAGDDHFRVIYHTVTPQDIINKYLVLPDFVYSVAINVTPGSSAALYDDFIFSGNLVLWEGLRFDGALSPGEILRIGYSQDSNPTVGSAIILNAVGSNSRVDSNNITDAGLGVYLSPNIKITHNNFYNTTAPGYTGSPPVSSVGNISDDPAYTTDYRLEETSASIGQANHSRWDDVYDEMTDPGNEKWSEVSFNRNIDRGDVNRFHLVGHVTGSMGAYEFVSGIFDTSAPAFVSEIGYDFSHFGGLVDPFYTPDRAFSELGSLDLHMNKRVRMVVGNDPAPLALNKRNFTVNNWELKSASFRVGDNTAKDMAIVHPTYPSITSDDPVYVAEDGDDALGDGSLNAPFKNISKALEEMSGNVVLLPGKHRRFNAGLDGKRIIPLKHVTFSGTGKKIYNRFTPEGWDISTAGSSTVEAAYDQMVFDHDVGSGTGQAVSEFDLVNDDKAIEIKFKALLGTNFRAEVYTDPPSAVAVPPDYPADLPDNVLFFGLSGTELTVGYRKLTLEDLVQKSLEYPVFHDISAFELDVLFHIKGDVFKITVKGADVDIVRTGTLEYFYDDTHTWKIRFLSEDADPSFSDDITRLSDLQVLAGDFVGVTGVGERDDGYSVGKSASIIKGA